MPTFSLAGQLRIQPTWTDTLSTTDVVDSVEIIRALTFANGTGSGQANAYWRDVRTVAATATDTIYLSNLPLSVFGGTGTLDMSTVRMIYIRNLSTSQRLEYMLPDNNFSIVPQGVFLWVAGSLAQNPPLHLETGFQLLIQNAGTSAAQYEIVIIGVKAT